MSTTVKQALEENTKKFLGEISHQLSCWLNEEKGVEISSEELCGFFEVKYKPPSTPGLPNGSVVQTQMPNIPNYFAGTGVSPAKKRGGRTKKTVDPSLPTCEYVFTRGKKENIGKKCPKPIANDGSLGSDRFCKQCLTKAAVKSLLEGTSTKSTVQPPVLPGETVQIPSEPSPKNEDLSVLEIEGQPGMYREINYGFILKQNEDGSVTAHKIDDNGTWRDLRENEKKIALAKGIEVINSDSALNIPSDLPAPKSAAKTNVPVVPQIGV